MAITQTQPNFDIRHLMYQGFKADKPLNKEAAKRFEEVLKKADEYIEKTLTEKAETDTQNQYVDIQHRAYSGDPRARNVMISYIVSFLDAFQLHDTPYDTTLYDSLAEAIFEEQYGWGPASIIRKKHKYQALKIIGTDVFLSNEHGQYQKLPYKFKNRDKVFNLAYRFRDAKPLNKLDPFQYTELEDSTLDGLRVSIMIPHRTVDDPVITIRKQTVSVYTLEELARLKTFPEEALELFKILARLYLVGIIAGPPSSGKSTLLMSFLNETAYTMQTLYAESNLEFKVREIYPGSPIIHVLAKEGELDQVVFPSILRHDIEQVLLGEVRKAETEFYGQAAERGIRKLCGTFHSFDPVNIPDQLARLNIQYHKQGHDYIHEYLRFTENLHFSITMDYKGAAKKVMDVQFYDLDPFDGRVSIHRVMYYDIHRDTWSYHNEIPERIKRIAGRHQQEEIEALQTLLDRLAEKYPMPEAVRKKTTLKERVT
jgi:pilus assembly protein CpaF